MALSRTTQTREHVKLLQEYTELQTDYVASLRKEKELLLKVDTLQKQLIQHKGQILDCLKQKSQIIDSYLKFANEQYRIAKKQ